MRPYRVIGFILLCFLLLVGSCLLFPTSGISLGFTTLTMPTMAHLLGNESEQADTVDIFIPTDTLPAEVSVSGPQKATPIIHQKEETAWETTTPIDTLLTDEYKYLAQFFLSLSTTDSTSVRVVHLGDSQIEEDRMTRELRRG